MARSPLLLFACAAVVLATTNADIDFARWAFFDPATLHWRGAGSWWINDVIHDGGRWLVRVVVAAVLLLWIGTFVNPRYAVWRRPAGYFVLATVLTVGIVGLLKILTNVDCAWDLAQFGGRFQYVHLFGDRPDAWPRAQCFPAAHASSGYALMALYFVGLELGRRWARAGLLTGIALGLIFGFAQQSRGAHLLSHDLWSAAFAWLVASSLYAFAFKCRLWTRVKTAVTASIAGTSHDS